MSKKWVEHFPSADPALLTRAEAFFIEKLTIHQQLEAIVIFASVLEEMNPGDVDFFITSNDPSLTKAANEWISMKQGYFWYKDFTPDFFFRVATNLNPDTIDGKRDFDREIYQSILDGRECLVFTKQEHANKYLTTFPNSFVVQKRS